MTDAESGLRFGLVAPAELKRAAALEELPIDSLWVGGHVVSRNPSTEAMVSLARLSAVTERVKVGTAVLLLPLYSPAIVAKQIADLDRATAGRVTLGVGVGGEYPQEFRACGIPLNERGRRVDEAIPLLRELWTAQAVSHDGAFYSMKDVKLPGALVQTGGPPIVVAGRKEVAMRRAATLGDGWMPYMYSPNRYASSVQKIRQIAESEGRDLQRFEWYVWLFVNVDSDGQAARLETAKIMGGTYDQDFSKIVDHVAAAGTTAEVIDRLNAFVAAGARHFIFMPATERRDADVLIRRLIDDVIPAVRAHPAGPGALDSENPTPKSEIP